MLNLNYIIPKHWAIGVRILMEFVDPAPPRFCDQTSWIHMLHKLSKMQKLTLDTLGTPRICDFRPPKSANLGHPNLHHFHLTSR